MSIEQRDGASVVTHPLARDRLTTLRDADTGGVAFREALVELGRICGYAFVDYAMDTESVAVRTPLAETTGERVAGAEDVVVVSVLRAAIPFVEGLSKAVPEARQGVVSASREEAAGRDADGRFPISVDYVNLPTVGASDTVLVADPMLATGSTMCAVLDRLLDGAAAPPEALYVLSAVAAPEGVRRVNEAVPAAEPITVAVDERLDDEGFIVPGLGDAGDRAFRTD